MKINYNVTGNDRKSLVMALAKVLDTPQKYLGAPTFGFSVGDCHIDKNGVLTGKDNEGFAEYMVRIHDCPCTLTRQRKNPDFGCIFLHGRCKKALKTAF